MMPRMPRAAFAALCLLCACRAIETPYAYPADLRHPNYVKRTKATAEFARRQDAAQLPGAFDLLTDPEHEIRALAYQTLRALSRGGRDFGYRPYLSQPALGRAAQQWRAWWEAGQPEEAPAAEAVAAPPAEEKPLG